MAETEKNPAANSEQIEQIAEAEDAAGIVDQQAAASAGKGGTDDVAEAEATIGANPY